MFLTLDKTLYISFFQQYETGGRTIAFNRKFKNQ